MENLPGAEKTSIRDRARYSFQSCLTSQRVQPETVGPCFQVGSLKLAEPVSE
jgi:hypothetical protein